MAQAARLPSTARSATAREPCSVPRAPAAAIAQRDAKQPLDGFVQLDEACLGGEQPGSTGGCSKNKLPFVAAVACNERSVPSTPCPQGR